MIPRPPKPPRPDTLFPYTTLFRAVGSGRFPYTGRHSHNQRRCSAESTTSFMLRLSILDPSAPVYYLIISGRHSGEDAMVFGAASFLSVKSSIRAARNLGAMLAALVTLHGFAIAQEAARVEEATWPSCEDQQPHGWLRPPQ